MKVLVEIVIQWDWRKIWLVLDFAESLMMMIPFRCMFSNYVLKSLVKKSSCLSGGKKWHKIK
jgi:hypothetical protein